MEELAFAEQVCVAHVEDGEIGARVLAERLVHPSSLDSDGSRRKLLQDALSDVSLVEQRMSTPFLN